MEIRRGSPRRRREYRQKVNDRPDKIEKCLGLLAERLEWRLARVDPYHCRTLAVTGFTEKGVGG
jgi:hypothetical protein